MDDITRAILGHLDAASREAWDVLPGQLTPLQPVCGEYPSATAGHVALVSAGYRITGRYIPIRPLDRYYDVRTLMRYADADGRYLVFVQRLSVVTAE